MAIKENKSLLEFTVAFNDSRSVMGIETSPIIDTANFDAGLSLVMSLNVVAANGDVEMINLLESDDSGMAGATTIATNNIIGNLADMTISGNSADNSELPSIGIIGNKRFITFDINFISLVGEIAVTVVTVKTRERALTNF